MPKDIAHQPFGKRVPKLFAELKQALAAWYTIGARQTHMSIREVLKVVNQMQAEGVIERYAIGGAVGATFYLEPIATLDVDIFITLRPE